MRRRILLIMTVLIVLIVATNVSSVLGTSEFPTLVSELIAGQVSDAGTVQIWSDGEYLYVVATTRSPDWSLDETHLYVGIDPPKKAAPGKFPYSGMGWYRIDLDGFTPTCDRPIYVALHAVVTNAAGQSETAWADTYGIPINENKGWAMYLEFPGELCPNYP